MANERNENNIQAVLPNSVEAEQNVLCCIMRKTDMQLEIISALKEDDFYQRNHVEIFKAMKEVSLGSHKIAEGNRANTVNFTTVVDNLRRNGKLAAVGDINYIDKLNTLLPSAARYEEYIGIVKRASLMRALIEACGEITKRAYSQDSAENVITYAEEQIFRLSQYGSNSGLVNLADEVAKTLKTIALRYTDPGQFRGLETGFKRLDKLTNGFHGGELIVLAARPGVGKSAMAMNIVEHAAKSGKTCAVFSLEMSNAQLIERLLSSMSGVNLEYIKNGQLTGGENDIRKLQEAHATIAQAMHIFGNDNANIRPAEISSQCRRLKAKGALDLIVVDYIGLMQSDRAAESRQNEVANITRAFKLLAKELDVPVLALSQLKRDVEIRNVGKKDGGSEPVLSDLRESGAIEQDADIVMFIHRDNAENEKNDDVTLIVAKHRNGETGRIQLKWLGNFVKFMDNDYTPVRNVRKTETAISESFAQEEENSFIMDDGGETADVPENDGAVNAEETSAEKDNG